MSQKQLLISQESKVTWPKDNERVQLTSQVTDVTMWSIVTTSLDDKGVNFRVKAGTLVKFILKALCKNMLKNIG